MGRFPVNNKSFIKILSANSLSKLGDSMHELVFLLLTISIVNNDFKLIGIIYFIKFIPYLLFGFLGGHLADNYNNKILMLFSDFSRAIITFLLCFLTYFNMINLLLLGAIAFCMTLLRIVFQPCFQSTIPIIVEKKDLASANSFMQISEEIGTIIGPSLAGILITHMNQSIVFALDACTYLISFIFIATFTVTRNRSNIQNKIISFKFLIGDTVQGIKNIFNDGQLLITIIISGFCILFVSSIIRFIFPIYLKTNFTSDTKIIGFALSTIALGTVIGALLYNKIWHTSSPKKLLFFWSAYGASLLMITAFPSQTWVITIAFIIGLIGAWVDICLVTNIQMLSTNENIGKNFSVFSTLANTGEASSGLIASFTIAMTSVLFCVNFFSALVIIIPLIMLFTKKWGASRSFTHKNKPTVTY